LFTLLNKTFEIDQNVISNGQKFGRLRTKDGHIISSFWIKRSDDVARNNYYVVVFKLSTNLFFWFCLLTLTN
jgi:hypothetical protein